MKTFGQILKELRLEMELSQVELANALYLNPSTITKYESEKIMTSIDILVKFADFFKVSIDYLLGREY